MNLPEKIDKKNIEDILPLTPTQEGMLFHYLKDHESFQYIEQLVLELEGQIEITLLEKAWNLVIKNNEILRACYRWIKDPLQIILRENHLKLDFYDLRSVECPLDEFKNIRLKDRMERFNLEKVPLRVKLCRLKDDNYRLLISNHHILFDGWSTGIIIEEVFTAYRDLVMGQESLYTVKPSFKTYLKRIHDRERGEEKEYWVNYLADSRLEKLSRFQEDYSAKKNIKAVEVIDIDQDFQFALQSFVQKHQITMATLLYTAWGILLQKYIDSDDVLFGITVSGRNMDIDKIDRMVGLFINTLPLRVKSENATTIGDLLHSIYNALQSHEKYTYTSLVDTYRYGGVMAGESLFDSIVIFENYPLSIGTKINGLPFYLKNYEEFEENNYDLSLSIFQGNRMFYSLTYDIGLFTQSFIQKMGGHLLRILHIIIEQPESSVESLEILNEDEKQDLLSKFVVKERALSSQSTIDSYFEEQVNLQPEKIALVFGKETMTYQKLNEKANKLARRLRAVGVTPDSIVGIMIERSFEMLISMLAVLKAGGAYLPIDPDYPRVWIEYMLVDSGVKVLLTQSNLQQKVDFAGQILDVYSSEVYAKDGHDFEKVHTLENLAYLIYTSGSTGKPKGVMIEHGSLENFIQGMIERLKLDSSSKVLALTTFSFDIFVLETLLPLAIGATVVLASSDEQRDPAKLSARIQDSQIDVLQITPSRLQLLIDGGTGNALVGVQKILVGGEPLSARLLENLRMLTKARIFNMYGPTETTVWSTVKELTDSDRISIGHPILNTQVYIVNRTGKLQPEGVAGELCIAGSGLARGYLGQLEMTSAKFVPNPFEPGKKMYKTGDLARWIQGDEIDFIGRIDNQVKIRGFRIEIDEIENNLLAQERVQNAVVTVWEKIDGEKYLSAYVVSKTGDSLDFAILRRALGEVLPQYMIPAHFQQLDKIPLTANGKVDKKALPKPEFSEVEQVSYVSPDDELEKTVATVWREILGIDNPGVNDNFFELGGSSLSIVRLHSRLKERLKKDFTVTDLFRYPTIRTFADFLRNVSESQVTDNQHLESLDVANDSSRAVAVIGVAGRFPGAKNIDEFWQNLINGVESISFFNDEELIEAGLDPALIKQQGYVKAKGVLNDIEYFDRAFFNYTVREANYMDPQYRIFHECVWEALENAGYDPLAYPGTIGLFAGATNNSYWLTKNYAFAQSVSEQFEIVHLNYNSFTTLISYKLNLRGPSVAVQTACSTSLVAIDLAYDSILNRKCNMAVAGGVSISLPAKAGYVFQEGMIFSPDGHTRTFDADAMGTISGNGVGTVVLKRLDKAIADGDHIYAVIKGSATNNDGNQRVSYTAPAVEGQAKVIKKAQSQAGVEAESISYVETHGTGTPLGDPIEVEGLKLAFGTSKIGFCGLGSLKTNIGHLDAAAGVTGFIKTVLALQHKLLPPSLNYHHPNPKIDFQNSPFYVNHTLKQWNGPSPLRAGVSSFGIGGTNAHVVLEEAPLCASSSLGREWKLLLFSGRTEAAVERAMQNLLGYFKKNPEIDLADAAYTLQIGRRAFEHRRMLLCSDINTAITHLENVDSRKIYSGIVKEEKPVIFVFSGQGSQYVNMGRELYDREQVFRNVIDECFELVTSITGENLKTVLYPEGNDISEAMKRLNQTEITQLILFIFEYSLATLLMHWGVQPHAMLGYSFGEYVVACIAGVLSLRDVLELVAYRGLLVQKQPGAMVSVPLREEEVIPLLNSEVSIAIINGPSCVVSGSREGIAVFEKTVQQKGYMSIPVGVSYAVHSPMMEPILSEYREKLQQMTFKRPTIPYISGVTGDWIRPEDATDCEYWVKHLRGTVRFSDGIMEILKKSGAIFLEIGPGRDLSNLIRRHIESKSEFHVINTIRNAKMTISDEYYLFSQIGQLWLAGAKIDWKKMYINEIRHRIPLPTYPFEREYCWPKTLGTLDGKVVLSSEKPKMEKKELADWFYIPTWKRLELSPKQLKVAKTEGNFAGVWLLLLNGSSLGEQIADTLQHSLAKIIRVQIGKEFMQSEDGGYVINPEDSHSYRQLFYELKKYGQVPDKILHFWNMGEMPQGNALDFGYYSIVNLVQTIGENNITQQITMGILSTGMQDVLGERVSPLKATLSGPCQVIAQEYEHISIRSIDIALPQNVQEKEWLAQQILTEMMQSNEEIFIAYRTSCRWIRHFEPLRLGTVEDGVISLRENGVYLLTGGTGGIGLVLAEFLAEKYQARLVLIARSELPSKKDWATYIQQHGENDAVVKKIQVIQKCEAYGSEVLIYKADVAQREEMTKVIDLVKSRFGKIDGVIHAAGIAESGLIQMQSRTKAEEIFKAKVNGTLLLEELLSEMKPDFILLCSSISAISSGFGQAAYRAANAFLDAFAHQKWQEKNMKVCAVNWDYWQETGLGVATLNRLSSVIDSEYLHNTGILNTEGREVFQRLLAAGLPQIVVSTQDIAKSLHHSLEAFYKHEESAVSISTDRPHLNSNYVAPINTFEEQMVDIWEEILGIQSIGIDDNFFELGGDSLKGITLVARIYQELHIKVSLADFFTYQTIRELVKQITDVKTESYMSIPKTELREYYPVSFAQKRLLILTKLDNADSYHISGLRKIIGKINVERLSAAFTALVNRHEALRTAFIFKDGNFYQQLVEDVNFSVQLIKANEEEIENLVAEWKQPFELARAPLLRVKLIEIGLDEYILYFDLHHLIADEASTTILFEELARLYEGKELSEISVQYKDYAVWQSEWQNNELIQKKEAFWLNYLEGQLPVLDLPTDFPRSEVFDFSGERVYTTLESDIVQALQKLVVETGSTMFTVLFAAYITLLFKYTDEEDIIVGTPITGRDQTSLLSTVGLFVNTIAMRNYPRGELSFREFLAEVKKHAMDAYANGDYPYENLVEKLSLRRDPSRNPLFDTMFTYYNNISVTEIDGLKFEPYKLQHTEAKFDLTISIAEYTEQMIIELEYCVKLFMKETVERLGKHFRNLLKEITLNPDILLADIRLASFEEIAADYYRINATDVMYRKDTTLQQLFLEQVKRTPDALAVVSEENSLTYRELNSQAIQLAKKLKEKAVGPEIIVSLLLKRSTRMIVAILAVLKAGGAYLPIDPDYPAERISYLIKDSEVKVLLTEKNILEKCFSSEETFELPETLFIENEENYHECGYELTSDVQPKNLAYVLYTSGTTGLPKGVMIEQRNVLNYVFWFAQRYNLRPGYHCLMMTDYTFDPSVGDIFGALLFGATLYIPDKYLLFDRERFAAYIEENQINMLNFVPTVLKELLSDQQKLSSIQTVITGGESLKLSVKNRLLAPGYKVYNHYGPTETTVDALVAECSQETKVTIGRPLANTQCYILDTKQNLLPIGIPGELYVVGDGVARGYLHNQPLTAEKFVTLFGQRMYRTGDLVRMLTNGEIEFRGRIDKQVKIRGIRIELSEIESNILELDSVRDVVVLERINERGEQYLCAYVVIDKEPDWSYLRSVLQTKLPEYMVPSHYVRLERVPLTSHGKIDYQKLFTYNAEVIVKEVTYVAPTNSLEVEIAEILKEILQIEKVGIYDNFFDLGGNSLQIIRLQNLLQEKLHIDVPVVYLFKYPTIESLARYLEKSTDVNSVEEANTNRLRELNKGKDRLRQQIQKRVRRT